MSFTRIIPTDKHGNVYRGPRTAIEAREAIDIDNAEPKKVVDMLDAAGFTGVARRIAREYGLHTPERVMEQIHDQSVICGIQIQHDSSGIGHAWEIINSAEIPANIQDEIAAEILDGGNEKRRFFVASNGLHYRW